MLAPLELELDVALVQFARQLLLAPGVLAEPSRHVLHSRHVKPLRLPPSKPRVHLRREQPLLQLHHLAHRVGGVRGGDLDLGPGTRRLLKLPADLRGFAPRADNLELQPFRRDGQLPLELLRALRRVLRGVVHAFRHRREGVSARRFLLFASGFHRRLDLGGVSFDTLVHPERHDLLGRDHRRREVPGPLLVNLIQLREFITGDPGDVSLRGFEVHAVRFGNFLESLGDESVFLFAFFVSLRSGFRSGS